MFDDDLSSRRLAAIQSRLRERMAREGLVAEGDHSSDAEKARNAHVGRVRVKGVPSAAGTVLGINLRTAASLGVFGALCWWFFSYDPTKGMDLNYRGPKIRLDENGNQIVDDEDDSKSSKTAKTAATIKERKASFIPSPPFPSRRRSAIDEEENFEFEDGGDDEDDDDFGDLDDE